VKLSPVRCRALSWDPCSLTYSLTTHVTQLTTINFHSSMKSKFSESLTNPMNASYFSLTLILWVTDALLTPWIWTLVWHNTYLTPESLIFFITGTSSVNLTCTSSIKNHGVFRYSIIFPQSCLFYIFSLHQVIGPYLLHNLQTFISGLSVCVTSYISQIKVRICFRSTEIYYIYWCQQAWTHPEEVPLFLSFLPSCTLVML
jgi:hypothetical protein